MKVKLLIFSFFLVFQFGFSQTEKPIIGKVSSDDFAIQGVEVLNLKSKKTTITDSTGKFNIMAKAEDSLMFVTKDYEYKRIILKKEDFEKEFIKIYLVRKPEQLEEIFIISKISFPKIKFDKNMASQLKVEKEAINKKPIGVYDGTIENGMGMTIPLGGRRKKPNQIEFKEFIKESFNDDFYIEKLKLKHEEIGLFIEFCDADPKSKTVIKNSNPLKSMDFLMSKKNEFDKMLLSENK